MKKIINGYKNKLIIILCIFITSCAAKTEQITNDNIVWDCDALQKEFGRWNKAGGKELKGLTLRRKAEVEPCFSNNKAILVKREKDDG